MATIINGKEVSANVKEQVAEEVKQLKEKGIHPGLAVVIVGEDPASKTYVKNKKLACQAVGIHSEEYALPAETTQEELLDLVHKLNEKQDIDGILVQSPLPKGLDEQLVIENINPAKDVAEVCRQADILVAAVGKAKFVTADMVKDGAVVIDVGMNRDENGKLCGDVDFDSVEKKASFITPVPGGVGPMTIAMLLKNTVTAAKQRAGIA